MPSLVDIDGISADTGNFRSFLFNSSRMLAASSSSVGQMKVKSPRIKNQNRPFALIVGQFYVFDFILIMAFSVKLGTTWFILSIILS